MGDPDVEHEAVAKAVYDKVVARKTQAIRVDGQLFIDMDIYLLALGEVKKAKDIPLGENHNRDIPV